MGPNIHSLQLLLKRQIAPPPTTEMASRTLLFAAVILSFVHPVPAPIPRCAPGRFLNSIIESDELAWVTGDMPGHPVEPCPYDKPKNAPKPERSLFWWIAEDPSRLPAELKVQGDFWTRKGLRRINDRFWQRYYGPGWFYKGKEVAKAY